MAISKREWLIGGATAAALAFIVAVVFTVAWIRSGGMKDYFDGIVRETMTHEGGR